MSLKTAGLSLRSSRLAVSRQVVCSARPISKAAPTLNAQKKDVSTDVSFKPSSAALLAASPFLWMLTAAPAQAYEFSGSNNSFWVSLGLFIMTVPGLWSLIKRAPKSKVKRKVYTVAGPAAEQAKSLDDLARQIATYFKKYNYRIVGTGEVITFEGTYQASMSQAFALSTYTFLSLASVALVLSTLVPEGGNWWYSMTLVSPAAGYYYWTNGTRNEQIKVKMVTSDDEKETDITIEGDDEEIDRFRTELDLVEKGKVRVKGLLEKTA